MTQIEWTEKTWNPIAGCNIVSPGCTNCYAMRMAHRLASNPATPHYAGTTKTVNGNPVWTGKIGIAPDSVLTAPLRRRKPTMYFVNSMSDLFAEGVPDEVIDRVFAVMALCPQHTFQVLTKRADRMREYMRRRDSQGHAPAYSYAVLMALTGQWNTPEMRSADFLPLSNVWLGVSVEDQARANLRIPDLMGTPAAVRFISAEPLLGPISLRWLNAFPENAPYTASKGPEGTNELDGLRRLDWVIVGGESGPGARPMHPDWARGLRDQCAAAGVPFFFKQWGGTHPKSGGRMLDGVEHSATPEVQT